MMGAQANLFSAVNYSVKDQVEMIDKVMLTKYACFHMSFGMDKGNAKGYVTYSALMTMIDYSGRCHVKSVDGTSLIDLIAKVFEIIQTP